MELLPFISGALFCGFVVGFCICFSGVGGGVLVIPVIAFFFDQPPSVAVGTAGIYATLTKAMAGIENARRRNIDYALFMRITLFAVPGTLLSAITVNVFLTTPSADTLQQVLRLIIIGAILLSLLSAHFKPKYARGLPVGAFFIGTVMGLTGIGGGVLIVPLMLAFSDASPKRIVGTSILTALVLSFLTAMIYSNNNQVNYALALWMSVGALLAAPFGGMMLHRASQSLVRWTMTALILLAAVLMISDYFF